MRKCHHEGDNRFEQQRTTTVDGTQQGATGTANRMGGWGIAGVVNEAEMRQISRMMAAYREEGAAALSHGKAAQGAFHLMP